MEVGQGPNVGCSAKGKKISDKISLILFTATLKGTNELMETDGSKTVIPNPATAHILVKLHQPQTFLAKYSKSLSVVRRHTLQ
jgi:hypothetical protein